MEHQEIELIPGQSFEVITGLPVKLMAIVDGYVMARHKGCFPFVETIATFRTRIKKCIGNQSHLKPL